MAELQNCRIAGLQNGRIAGFKSCCHAGIAVGRLTTTICHGTCNAPAVAMNSRAEELKARTKRFALDVIRFVNELPRVPAADVMGRQLLKAGTGVAANYRSSCRSRSHAEFAARIGVVLEEADESELWLELFDQSKLPNVNVPTPLLQESRELRAIFARSSLTARNRG
jgi:four helix bundle protein